MNKKKIAFIVIIVVLVIAVLVALAFIYNKAQSPTTQLQSLSRGASKDMALGVTVLTSNTNPKLGEVFNVTALVQGPLVKKVVIKIDKEVVKTCEKEIKECSADVGPFEKKDIGAHTYAVDVTNSRDIVEVYAGEFTVSAEKAAVKIEETETLPSGTAKETTKPTAPAQTGSTAPTTPSGTLPAETQPSGSQPGGSQPGGTPSTPPAAPITIDKVTTSGDPIDVGQTFSVTVYVKPTTAIAKIVGLVDGNKFKTCENTYACGMILGPMNNSDIGKHSWQFEVTAKSGEQRWLSGAFMVVASDVPTPPATPADTVAPTVKIESSKTIVYADTTVGFKATADDASGIKKIAIAFGDKIVKECFAVKECYYVAGPFVNIAADTKIIFGATAYDNAGNSLSTPAQYITVKPAEQIIQPTVSLDSADEALLESKSTTFTLIVNPGSKKLDYVDAYVGGELAKTCYANCKFFVGPFTPWAGQVVKYYAKAYFTDGSAVFSPQKSLSVVDEVLPTVAISLSPDQRLIMAYEDAQISSFVDAQGLDVFTHDIYVNGVKKMSCLDSKCFYSERASNMLGYEPQVNTTMTYYSKASLSNGQTIMSATGSVTVKPGQAPQ